MEKPTAAKSLTGYVYCVSFTDGVVKIGSTKNPATRFQQLQGGVIKAGHIIDNIWMAECINYRQVETEIHNSIPARKRIRVKPFKREWYNMPYYEALRYVEKKCAACDGMLYKGRKAVIERFKNLITQSEANAKIERLFTVLWEVCDDCEAI